MHAHPHTHTRTLLYSPVRSSSGPPTCSSRHHLSLEHGRWRNRCQAVGRWICRCSAHSSYLHWSPHHQTSVFHCLRVAFVALRKRQFWECRVRVNSHQGLDLGDPVALVCLALQGVHVLLEAQGSLEALEAQTLSSFQSNPGGVETQLSALGLAETWRRDHIPSCSFRAFHNGSLHFQHSLLWLCGPAREWQPRVLGPLLHLQQLRWRVSCGWAVKRPASGSPLPPWLE